MNAVTAMHEASANSLDTYRWGKGEQDREKIDGSDLADSTNVLISGFLVKAEILIETKSNVVAVQAVDKFAQMQQVLL
jgi:hypothetical protein